MSMTVNELATYLADQPEDALVVMSKGGEGNDFSPLDEAGASNYLAENTWSGEITDEAQQGSVFAVVLWPVN